MKNRLKSFIFPRYLWWFRWIRRRLRNTDIWDGKRIDLDWLDRRSSETDRRWVLDAAICWRLWPWPPTNSTPLLYQHPRLNTGCSAACLILWFRVIIWFVLAEQKPLCCTYTTIFIATTPKFELMYHEKQMAMLNVTIFLFQKYR